MRHFPVFLDLAQRRVLVCGGGAVALAKLRLLLKTEARIEVFAPDPAPELRDWASQGRLALHARALAAADLAGAALVYAATGRAAPDRAAAVLARAARVPVNLVDNLEDSDFITPALIDRDPVCVAIGTEGTAPVLARRIKAGLEAALPADLGARARAAGAFRARAEALPDGAPRRAFWQEVFDGPIPGPTPGRGRAPDWAAHLARLFDRHLRRPPPASRVIFAEAAHPDPEMLVLKTRKALDAADVVVFEAAIAPAIRELARREATLIEIETAQATPHLARLLQTHARQSHLVLTLTRAAAPVAVVAACRAAGLDSETIPGVPAPAEAALRKESA